jgi:Myb-like DNA-binding protein FlbD
MAPSHRRGPWVPEEDQALLQLVREQGPNNWVRISQHMHFRSPKQCRERFHQNLKPSLNHAPISAEEGMMIEQMVNEMGKRWAEIARRLGNRSDNAVKNWWNGSMNRKRRGMVIQTGHASRTCNGRVEAPYPRASTANGHMRRSSWTLVKDADGTSRHLAPIFTYPANHPVEAAMTSPAFSEASSLEPPSMVSDHNSVSSASPRAASSPQMLPLPVDVRQAYAERRGSAPVFHLQSAAGPIPDEVLSASSSDLLKRWGPDCQTSPFRPSGHHHSNSLPDASLSPQEDGSEFSQRSSRDARMGLDSLLN